MIKLERGSAPDFWTEERVQQWTQSWLDKECKSNRWYWPEVQKISINQHAFEAMKDWHHFKCAFCEERAAKLEIEHFRSKTGYGSDAFQ